VDKYRERVKRQTNEEEKKKYNEIFRTREKEKEKEKCT
jgi:hypothetical protein